MFLGCQCTKNVEFGFRNRDFRFVLLSVTSPLVDPSSAAAHFQDDRTVVFKAARDYVTYLQFSQ